MSPDDFAPDDFWRTDKHCPHCLTFRTSRTCNDQQLLGLVPKFQGENFYKNKTIVDEIKKLAAKKGYTVTQIALAWVAAQGMIAIPGTTQVARLEENWASRDIDFSQEELQEMRTIVDSAKPIGDRFDAIQESFIDH